MEKGKMICRFIIWILIGFIITSVVPGGCRPIELSYRYTIVDLGVLPGYDISYAFDVNEFDQVVGTSKFSDPYSSVMRAFLWENGSINELHLLPGAESIEAFAINDCGQIVGYIYVDDPDNQGHYAVLWENDRVFDLGRLGDGELIRSFATDINNAGLVVGFSATPSWETHAFLYDINCPLYTPGNHSEPINCIAGIQDLGTLGGWESWATNINNRGQIVGESDTSNGYTNVFLYNPWSSDSDAEIDCCEGEMLDLGYYPAGSMGRMFAAINDYGQVVFEMSVYNEDEGRWEIHVVRWEGGMITDLGTLPESIAAWSAAINNAGQVVGWSSDGAPSWNPRAFLWEDDHMINLTEELQEELGSEWILQKALGINEAGSIVGVGINPEGEQHGFLLRRNINP